MPANDPPVGLPLAFRVGVTGARDLDAAALPALREAVAEALRSVRQECLALASEPWARAVHAADGGMAEAHLTLLSPLAEGADRLVVGEALDQSYALTVALPFAQADYERDFPDSVEAFRTLLDRAEGRVLALDGGRGEDKWRSYEAVGRLVVRNCDLLVAVWDESVPPKGRGGTEDTIRFALRIGVPVWWVHASGKKPSVFIEDPVELRHPGAHAVAAQVRLLQSIAARLKAPDHVHVKSHGILRRVVAASSGLAGLARMTRRRVYDPLRAFLGETEPQSRLLWRAHATVMRALAYGVPRRENEQTATAENYWARLYDLPDRLSNAYAARYRSTYVYVFALAALALSCAALALALEALRADGGVMPVAIGEFLALGAILVLVFNEYTGRWHERWIGYRLLAELCRKQGALATLGWGLPTLDVSRATSAGAATTTWISWYFEAAVRAAPLVTGSLGGEQLKQARDIIRSTLLAGQIAYHHHRAATSHRAASRLLLGGEVCFFLTLICVLAKLAMLLFAEPSADVVILGLAAAVLPALSAAFFAIRAYAELEVLADQSERMGYLLEALKNRLDAIDLANPLASQELGLDLYHLATAMLADVAGWAQIFRMKAVEAG